jgi:16S rRNA (adenine1518-N6/adenine1519-N6)-dimethyltransferase
MMQKEVAERIKADPGSRTYGALSVAVQYYCTVETVEEVPKENFMPAPKVDSTVLRLDVREKPAVSPKDEGMFFRCVRAGFSMRRKTLLNSLTATGFTKDEIRKALETAGIDPKRRAETLSLEDFAALADAFME